MGQYLGARLVEKKGGVTLECPCRDAPVASLTRDLTPWRKNCMDVVDQRPRRTGGNTKMSPATELGVMMRLWRGGSEN